MRCPAPEPRVPAEALALIETGLDFLNGADLPGEPVASLADFLRTWSRLDAKRAAAEASLVGAFAAAGGPAADGQSSTSAWLTFFTRSTPSASQAMVADARRMDRHPELAAALAAGAVTVSCARWLMAAISQFRVGERAAVERILVEAAVAGLPPADLSSLAAEMYRRIHPEGPEHDEERESSERGVTVGRTFGGAGRINGDLTRHATALAETVIESLSVRRGAEDSRTKRQRRHDALVEAFQRLLDSDLLPERGGAKPHVKIDMDLETLRRLDGATDLESDWIRKKASQLSLEHSHESGGAADDAADVTRDGVVDNAAAGRDGAGGVGGAGGDDGGGVGGAGGGGAGGGGAGGVGGAGGGGAGGDGAGGVGGGGVGGAHGDGGGNGFRDAARADALTGAALPPAPPGRGATLSGTGSAATAVSGRLASMLSCDALLTPTVTGSVARNALVTMTTGWARSHGLAGREACAAGAECGCDCHRPMTPDTHARLQETLLRWAADVLSGPDGLACHLRTGLLDGALATRGIVLDTGESERTVPAPLDRAVRRRDMTCRFPGCRHPAGLSQVHHVVPRSRGGPTRVSNLLTLCAFHHLIAVHTWGWVVRLNGDGTVTAAHPTGRTLQDTPQPVGGSPWTGSPTRHTSEPPATGPPGRAA